jgi:hypothetical protein
VPDFKAYTCVINNPYLSIEIHSVMQICIAFIPLITYTLPNYLATHNNAGVIFLTLPSVICSIKHVLNLANAKFKTCLLLQITDGSVKKITTKTVC